MAARSRDRFPPHTRGWTLPLCGRQPVRGVSPAHAGMDRGASDGVRFPSRFPRTRGDGPSPAFHRRSVWAFPPHTRGWTAQTTADAATRAVSPAHAGMDPSPLPDKMAGPGAARATRRDSPGRSALPRSGGGAQCGVAGRARMGALPRAALPEGTPKIVLQGRVKGGETRRRPGSPRPRTPSGRELEVERKGRDPAVAIGPTPPPGGAGRERRRRLGRPGTRGCSQEWFRGGARGGVRAALRESRRQGNVRPRHANDRPR